MVKAAQTLPDLASLGYQLKESGREPTILPGADMAQAIYQKGTDTQKAVLLKIYLLDSPASANELYGKFAAAFKNPPPDVLQADSNNVDTPAPGIGDKQKSYVTGKADKDGNRVYTDILVAGRTVLLVQIMDAADVDLMSARTEIARQVFQRAGEVR